MRNFKKGVMQITDANIGLVFGIVMLGVILGIVTWIVSDNQYSIAATHAIKVSDAAEKYIADNSDTISTQATPTSPYTFTASTLVTQGYLPSNFSATNNFSQGYRIMVLEPADKKFHTLIVTTGGNNLTIGQAVKIGVRIGAIGGYVQSGVAKGSQGGWSDSLSSYGFNPGDGHVALAQFFSYGVSTNDFLYRKQVAGHPELNTMSTDLNMGGNSVNAANNVSASGTVSATNVTATANVTATGTVAAGTTRTTGETYTGGWFRTTGDSGWFSEKWGGGLYMTDSTWVRVYNGKSFYSSGEIRGNRLTSEGRATVGEYLQLNGVAAAGNGCSPNGLVGRTSAGAILSCKDGIWQGSSENGSYQYLGGFVNQYNGYNSTGSTITVYAVGGQSTVHKAIQDGDCSNTWALTGYSGGLAVASAADNNTGWSKNGTINFQVPANTSYTIVSSPNPSYGCSPGQFGIYNYIKQ